MIRSRYTAAYSRAIRLAVKALADENTIRHLNRLSEDYDRAHGEMRVLEERARVPSPIEGSGGVTAQGNGRRGSWARGVHTSGVDLKAFTSGGFTLPPALDPDVLQLGDRARFVHQLLDTVTLDGTDRYSFLRQTVRTNNAAAVAADGTKPTSVLTVERVEQSVSVLAHVSEAIDRNLLSDESALRDFLDGEMRLGVLLEEDDQIINGSGTAPNLRGILNTSGIGTQALGADSRSDAMRKAITLIQLEQLVPNAVIMAPSDFEQMSLEKTADGVYLHTVDGAPINAEAATIWGLPVLVTTAIAAGTAIVGDFTQARLWVREEVVVTFSEEHSDLFVKNQLIARAEERVGFAVLRPTGFVQVTGI